MPGDIADMHYEMALEDSGDRRPPGDPRSDAEFREMQSENEDDGDGVDHAGRRVGVPHPRTPSTWWKVCHCDDCHAMRDYDEGDR